MTGSLMQALRVNSIALSLILSLRSLYSRALVSCLWASRDGAFGILLADE
jgi:hypothetical protein